MFRAGTAELERNGEFIVVSRDGQCRFWPLPLERVAGAPRPPALCAGCARVGTPVKLVSLAPLPKINVGVFSGQLRIKRILCEILSVNVEK